MVQGQDLNDPRYQTQNTLKRLKKEIDHLRAAIDKVDEPQFKATAITAVEVLTGLVKAFQNYEKKFGEYEQGLDEGTGERHQVGSRSTEEGGTSRLRAMSVRSFGERRGEGVVRHGRWT